MTFIAFLGLGYPGLLCINILFIIYWLLFFKKHFLLSLICILLGWFQLKLFVQINLSKESADTSNSIKVMSYNVRLFDLYRLPKSCVTKSKIFDLIKEEDPDILCLQEFYVQDVPGFNTLDTMLLFMSAKNAHVVFDQTILEKHHIGMATFSKYPIVNKGRISFHTRENNGCIFTDLLIGTDTVRVYNMHLQSIHLSTTVYTDSTKSMNEEVYAESKNIFMMIYGAFKGRAIQVDSVTNNMKNCKYKKIICADINDAPSSYAYHSIRADLNDAFVESGNGFGQTYIGKMPSFRIDCIFHSDSYKAIDFHMPNVEYSDHYPLVCRLKRN